MYYLARIYIQSTCCQLFIVIKEGRDHDSDLANSEGVMLVSFLNELLKEAFELKPQSRASAKKVLFFALPEAIICLNSSTRYVFI